MENLPKKVLIVGEGEQILQMQDILSGLDFAIEIADNQDEIRQKAKDKNISAIIFNQDDYRLNDHPIEAIQDTKKDFLVVASKAETGEIKEARNSDAKDFIISPYNYREFILRFNALVHKKIRISCIGGGTGLFTILLGLKTIPDILITAIVSMSDDGGSSGRLKASFGILPPGDVRRSLVALSNAPLLMNEVMQHRFQKGAELSGHNFGNLFLTALSEIKGSMLEAVKALGDILNIRGIVLPVTAEETTLCAEFEDGRVIKGESKIDLPEERSPDLEIKRLWQEPQTECDVSAYASIINSEILILGPGDLFTSIVTNLLVGGIQEAIVLTKAKKVYICNLMTKPGETANFNAASHIREVIKYLKGDYLDYLIISNTKLSDQAVSEYAKKNQFPVEPGEMSEIKKLTKAEIILSDVGLKEELVRHDSWKIKREINRIIQGQKGGMRC